MRMIFVQTPHLLYIEINVWTSIYTTKTPCIRVVEHIPRWLWKNKTGIHKVRSNSTYWILDTMFTHKRLLSFSVVWKLKGLFIFVLISSIYQVSQFSYIYHNTTYSFMTLITSFITWFLQVFRIDYISSLNYSYLLSYIHNPIWHCVTSITRIYLFKRLFNCQCRATGET